MSQKQPAGQPDVATVLAAAVAGVGGEHRAGQLQMAQEIQAAFASTTHLLVQAGTGTGKSLGYLVPALLHGDRVVIATATLALQHQLIERDLPQVLASTASLLPAEVTFAVLKGRSNYACLQRVREGVPDEDDALIQAPSGSIGAEVVALRQWAEEQADAAGDGDRDAAPRHRDQAWRQVSVTGQECLGSRCAYVEECFAERANHKAAAAQIIVTNHTMLALDAMLPYDLIPEFEVVVVDEAHELQARLTQAATELLSPAAITRVARRAGRHTKGDEAADLDDAGEELLQAIAATTPGNLEQLSPQLEDALILVRDAAREVLSGLPKPSAEQPVDAGVQQVQGQASDILATADRMLAATHTAGDVLWLNDREEQFGGRQLAVAPLHVDGLIRDHILPDRTGIFTSATLKIGGDFAATAHTLGLAAAREGDTWKGIDVGSPFDYGRQAILYLAAHLPPPGRDGLSQPHLDEMAELITAAGGRTLGLFSSRRAAAQAAEVLREKLPQFPILLQGEAQISELREEFGADAATCLFGTLSLWQGFDAPGDTCQLVLIDRLPFPRPDDPLMSARQQAAAQSGRNGFMTVAATHAALLLAQGAGRLIRTAADKGVVAVLDPRLATARYGTFLRASLPPMWTTRDGAVVRQALARLDRPVASQ